MRSDDRGMSRISGVETTIRALGPGQQAVLALDLATLVEPLAQLSPRGQPEGGLPAVADAIRVAKTRAEVDQARHRLWSTPELQIDDGEPEDASWFTFGATIAWIYAADSRCTAPADGAVNTFKRVLDLLDGVDLTLGDTDLVGDVIDAVEAALDRGGAISLRADEVVARIRAATSRIAPIP